MDNPNLTSLQLIADDKKVLLYRPKLRSLTGSVTAAILLQQIIYWANKSSYQPFYKFKQPCSHKLYQQGSSWEEELAYSRAEFDAALKQIATKVTAGSNKAELLQQLDVNKLVFYWTTASRVTYYELNTWLAEAYLLSLLSAPAELFTKAKAEKLLYLSNAVKQLYQVKQESSFTMYSEFPALLNYIDNQRLPIEKELPAGAGNNGTAKGIPALRKAPKPKKDTVPKEQLDAMVKAMATVCVLDLSLSYAKLARTAKKLIQAGYLPEQVTQHFSKAGAWYKDFPGTDGSVPLFSQIPDRLPRYVKAAERKAAPTLVQPAGLPDWVAAAWEDYPASTKAFIINNPNNYISYLNNQKGELR